MTSPAASQSASEAAVVRKVARRLIPFLFVLFGVAFLDRVNIGFAALQFKTALNFSDATYGLGAGIFFVGYLLFQVPSNIALVKIGARRWIAILMIGWGAISASMMFVQTPFGFYTLRFLLGAAEAGFFPGVILYMTYWFPATLRARSVSWFLMALPLSGIIGGPLAGTLLSLQGVHGLAGWQWLFLIEGVPAIVLGATVYFVLTENPKEATWLSQPEKTCLLAAIQRETKGSVPVPRGILIKIISSREVWLLCGTYFTLMVANYGLSLWLPEVVKNFSGFSNWGTGMFSTIPYFVAIIMMSVVASRADRTRKPHAYFAASAFAGAAAFALSTQVHNIALSIVCLSVSVAGIMSAIGPFWAMPGEILSGATAPAGIAFINSLGNLGGLFGPWMMGKAKQFTGTFTAGSALLGVVLFLSACLALVVRSFQRRSAP